MMARGWKETSPGEWQSPGATQKIARRWRGIRRTLLHFVGQRLTDEVVDEMERIASSDGHHGWGRRLRKRLKLEKRGTYRRADQWRLASSLKQVWRAAEALARSVSAETGRPCAPGDFLEGFTRPGRITGVCAPIGAKEGQL